MPLRCECGLVGCDGSQCLSEVSQYLKDGETASECIARNRRDVDTALGLLAKEKLAREALEDTVAAMREAQGVTVWPAPDAWRMKKLSVIEFHEIPALRERFYAVVDDLRAGGSIVDIWIHDIARVLDEHGYQLTVRTRKPLPSLNAEKGQ